MLRLRSTLCSAILGLGLILGADGLVRAEDEPVPDPGAETARALLKARQDNARNQHAGRPSVWMWAPRGVKGPEHPATQAAPSHD